MSSTAEQHTKELLEAVVLHTEATGDLIWSLVWLQTLLNELPADNRLKAAFLIRLQTRRQERATFHTLCSEVGI